MRDWLERRAEPRDRELSDAGRDLLERLKDCQRAIRWEGPIRPQGTLYVGMTHSIRCRVLMAEVAAFLLLAGYEVPAEMRASAGTTSALPVASPNSVQSAEPMQAPIDGPDGAKRWTPALLEELRAYRAAHGTKQAAKWASVSEARVRELLPGDKPAHKGYSAFTHRAK